MKEIRIQIPDWISAELAISRDDGIYWLDARCDICGSECVRAHKTGYGFIVQCLDCKQEETLQDVNIAVRDWRI